MPDGADGFSKYITFLTISCITQFCLGILLIICGSLAVSYTYRHTDSYEPLCHAAVFLVGILMIIAGFVSCLIQRQEDYSFDVHYQGGYLIYIEQGLSVLICLSAITGFVLCTISELVESLEKCKTDECRKMKIGKEVATLTNMVFLIASAFLSVFTIWIGCKYGHQFREEGNCYPLARPTRSSLETDERLKLSSR